MSRLPVLELTVGFKHLSANDTDAADLNPAWIIIWNEELSNQGNDNEDPEDILFESQ